MKRTIFIVLAVMTAGFCLGGCARFTGWERPDITTGEPGERNEVNRGILDTDDSFGTGMGHAEHHMDW